MKWEIYEELIKDTYILEHAKNRIKFHKYPEVKSINETHIVIDPLDVPKPDDFADNNWMTDDYLFQIDVFSKHDEVCDEIAKRIQLIMWNKLNFVQVGGVPQYDEEYDLYRDARRYRGKAYREFLNKNRSDY